ncbi:MULTISPECIES: hypothetical protein [Methanosarcina]|uniref:hypothetical protein n=1 Tax=Methanosarcina TaxID=2207 RepID=UPI00064F4820|nr:MULTISPECIES: hypothetical protein [Methanosarcina]
MGLETQAFSKRVDRKPEKHLNFMNLSPNPIGVINRRNGCGTIIFKKGLIENPKNRLSFMNIPKPYRRYQPAQRLRAKQRKNAE